MLSQDSGGRATEAQLRALFEAFGEAVGILSAVRDETNEIVDWRIRDVNAAAAALLGVDRKNLIGRRAGEILEPEVFRAMLEGNRSVVESGASPEREYEFRGRRLIGRTYRIDADTVASASTDITDLRNAEEASAARHKEAEQLLKDGSHRKDEFLAMLSHELRNPLGAITNAIAVLQKLGPADPTLKAARDIIDRQSGHLVRVVEDLLDVSRVTGGKLSLKLRRTVLDEAVTFALEMMQPLLTERSQTVVLDSPKSPLLLEADSSRLVQVIGNVLHNASKYSPNGTRIRVSVESGGSEAILRVRDEGVGIPADLLPNVFEPFVQGRWELDPSVDRSRRGLGLGLTLVRSLVELHGGSIEAASAGRGRGSEFTIRLPLLAAVPDSLAAPVEAADPARPLSRRILVVDDSVDSVAGIAMLLGISGHEIRTCHDGETAVAFAADFRPDVILLDLGLPGIDGYEVARQIRSKIELEGVALYAVTGYGQAEDRRKTREAGFDGHLVKPIRPDELLELIAHQT